MAQLTPAQMASYYDARIAAEQAAEAANQAEAERMIEELRDALDAEIMAAAHEAGIDPEHITIRYGGNNHKRHAQIAIPGFAAFEIRAEYAIGHRVEITTWAWFNGSTYGQIDAAGEAITNAMHAARRQWLEVEKRRQAEQEARAAEEAARQAEAAQRQQHDADALAAWAPDYRQYLDRLIAAHSANAAILQPIAAELGGREFSAARLTYGITADDADPTTDTTWIAGGGQTDDGYWLEIDRQGQIEPALIYHAVKLSAARTWTAAGVYEESGSNATPDTPPIRTAMIRTGAGNWLIAAPPADHYLRSEILAMIAASGQQLERVHSEEIPPPPALWNPSAGEELARRLESETAGDLDTLAALSGSFAGDFPSADPIPF